MSFRIFLRYLGGLYDDRQCRWMDVLIARGKGPKSAFESSLLLPSAHLPSCVPHKHI